MNWLDLTLTGTLNDDKVSVDADKVVMLSEGWTGATKFTTVKLDGDVTINVKESIDEVKALLAKLKLDKASK